MALPHCCPSASFFLPSPLPSLSSPPPTNCLRRRTRHQMSTELRLSHRLITASWSTPAWASNPSSRFASYGFPSSSLAPFILGRFPKYSKPSLKSSRIIKASSQQNHPAFKPFSRTKPPPVPPEGEDCISLTEKGITYKLQNAPFEFQYSYTETPKVKPLALREPAFLPFGPKETPRPWTGRAPLPGTKKKLPEFDSFKLPPPGKKGVKSIQAPGPFKSGSAGPKYTISRDEILGAPLTKVEVAELVRGCLKTSRQLNIGRNGLTHNMLDNIHAHWKRRRVCKIKCKGVCTVDMDNVCDVLEEKTGGKIIHRRGGSVFLFRGRNYNYKFRPRYPLMLWRPITPVYPRLIKPVPEGLTLEQANEMRLKGSNLPPICKLGKNGVYNNLPKQVREAFEACELVRVNCEGMNKSDYKKIGGKLKDLVPCVLISFEGEHILMWRGLTWKSSLPPVEEIGGSENASSSKINGSEKASSSSMHESVLVDTAPKYAACDISENNSRSNNEPLMDENRERSSKLKPENTSINDGTMTNTPLEAMNEPIGESKQENNTNQILTVSTEATKLSEESKIEEIESKIDEEAETACLEGVKLLLNQAMESGSALMLSEIECNDSDIVYQRSFELAKTARKGPSFQVVGNKSKSSVQKKKDKIKKKGAQVLESANPQPEREITGFNSEKSVDRSSSSSNRRMKKEEFLALLPSVLSQHSLKVDELARLLS